MNGRFGVVSISPEQFRLVNSIFIIILVKTFDLLIYPLCGKKYHIKAQKWFYCLRLAAKFNLLMKPLQKIVTGGVILSLAFFVSAALESQLEKTYPQPIKEGHSRIAVAHGIKGCKDLRVMVTVANNLCSSNQIILTGKSSFNAFRTLGNEIFLKWASLCQTFTKEKIQKACLTYFLLLRKIKSLRVATSHLM